MKSLLILLLIPVLFSCNDKSNNTPKPEQSQGTIEIKNLQLHYKTVGQGEKVVLFAHAGFLDHKMWDTQVAALQDKYRLVLVDLPAHGASSKNDTSVLIADALNALLDSLQINKASIVGLSLGSVAVTDFAIAYPQRVDKLVLVAPGIAGWEKDHPLDSATKQYLPDLMNALKVGDTAAAAEVFTHYWGDGPYRTAGAWDSSVRGYIYRTTLATMYKNKVSGWPRFATPPAIDRLPQITAPTLVVVGDKDMPYILEASAYLEKTIKGAKKVVIPNVAHMLNMEAPEAFNKALLEFLNQ